ncbi:STAS domain-containing protein, partial [Bacteroidota bacterium]
LAYFSTNRIMLKLNIEDGIYRISFYKTRKVNTLIANPLREELSKIVSKPGREVVLSMEGINFIDSSGFQAIMDVVERANRKGSRFRISDVSQEVYELLKLMKLSFVFEINPDKSKVLSGVA